MEKLCRVVVLPKQTTEVGDLYLTSSGTLAICDYGTLHLAYRNTYGLYIISSSDPIEVGDWVYNSGLIFQWAGGDENDHPGREKVVASTDTLAYWVAGETHYRMLPKLPQSFVDEYAEEFNKKNFNNSVLVEYEGIVRSTTWEHEEPEAWRVKVVDDTISIRTKLKNAGFALHKISER